MSGAEAHGAPWRTACRALARARARAEDESAGACAFAYRWEHVQMVVGLALRIGAQVGADCEVVEAAAWLHDICKGQPQHAAGGAAEARTFLAGTDFAPARVEAVATAIAQHEGLTRPPNAPPLRPLEAAVLWDADKLSKIGVSALALTLSAPHVQGDTLAARRTYTTDFVHDVLARTVQSMNTEPARAMAQRRYASLCAALEAWQQEEAEARPLDSVQQA